VVLRGQDVTSMTAYARSRAGVCLVPEGRGIFRSLTVRENLKLQIPSWSTASVERAFDAFPVLKERLKQVAGTMSGGQQQMLAVARCYLSNPSVVLLDEVSTGLAPRMVDQIFDSLTKLASDGVSLLLVEQYVHHALAMADTVYTLNRGEITSSGSAAEFDEEVLARAYMGSDGPSLSSGDASANGHPDRD